MYRHFDDVADALAAVEVRALQQLTAAIDELPDDADGRTRFEQICSLWIGRSTRESAAVRFLRSPEGVLQRAHRGDPSISALVGVLRRAVADLVADGVLPEQDLDAGVLVWVTLFDERLVVDLSRTQGWTTRRMTDYLSRAVLGALGALG